MQQAGMAVMALGVALLAGAVDLPSVAARALDAAWLAVVSHALCWALFGLCADSVEQGAGTRRLDRLGGLIHHMPVTGCCCLCGLFVVAALPPGLGFAAFWLVFQSLLAAARIGGLGLQVAIAGIAALTAFSVAIAALASVRLFGVAFLGRPRTPRAAAAEDVRWPARPAIVAVAGLVVLVGLLPWLALLPASGWTGAAPSVPWLSLRAGGETPDYSAVAVAALTAIVGFALFRLRRRLGERQREPAWSGGFAAPPAWLPFGDPVTQYGPASFVEPLRRLVAVLPAMALPPDRLARSRAALRAAVARVTG
jgi:hydrogenase-4 component B